MNLISPLGDGRDARDPSETVFWERNLPLTMDHGSYTTTTAAMKNGAVDPLAFYVGPVRVRYAVDPAKSIVTDLSPFIKRDQQVVRSNTRQIELDYGRGICRLDTPNAQGVCGFLSLLDSYALSTLTIKCSNPYAAVLAVSLDDHPLARSHKVLIQVGTTAHPTGWKTATEETKIAGQENTTLAEKAVELGSAPWQIAATHVTISLTNTQLAKATLLDTNGSAVGDVPVTRAEGHCQVVLPRDTMYLILSE